MIEGSGAGSVSVSQTNGPGFGRPKNKWILRIRIRSRNTVARCREAAFFPTLCVKCSFLIKFQLAKDRLITSWQFQSFETDPLKMFKQWPKGSRRCFGYHQCFGSLTGFVRIQSGHLIRVQIGNPDPQQRKKNLKNFVFEEPQRNLRHMGRFFIQKNSKYIFLFLYLFKAIIAYRTHCFCLELKDKRPTMAFK
jgi:hypothetical protein